MKMNKDKDKYLHTNMSIYNICILCIYTRAYRPNSDPIYCYEPDTWDKLFMLEFKYADVSQNQSLIMLNAPLLLFIFLIVRLYTYAYG